MEKPKQNASVPEEHLQTATLNAAKSPQASGETLGFFFGILTLSRRFFPFCFTSSEGTGDTQMHRSEHSLSTVCVGALCYQGGTVTCAFGGSACTQFW